ncbi:MAG: glycosyltransferase family 39 protein [Candidatus Aenigmarchaeota archaeon]|nr:glycosyltransferase family 39 protein [Candidatus Aenigmarchaeota archaeon]
MIKKYYFFIGIFILLTFLLFNFITEREKNYFSVDEKVHINNSKYVFENSFFVKNPLKYIDFPAPTTPLANIFFGFFIIFSDNLIFLRFVNLIVAILCIFVFQKILELKKIKDKYKVLSFVVFPYFVILSQLVMTDIFGLFMCLISVYFFELYKKTYNKKDLVFSSIFATLAFFSRQYYIFVSISQGISLFFKKKDHLILYFIFLIPIFLYIYLQKGFTPIDYRDSYNIEIIPIKLYIISSIGFYFLPQIFSLKIRWTWIFAFVFTFILFKTNLFINQCSGISCRLWNYEIISIILTSLGFILIIDFLKNTKDFTMILYSLTFIVEQFFNSMPYDRYFLSIYWLFLLHSKKETSKIQFFYTLFITIIYIFYKVVLT